MNDLTLLYQIRHALDFAISEAEDAERLRTELATLKADYMRLLDSSIKHAQQSTGSMIKALLEGKVDP